MQSIKGENMEKNQGKESEKFGERKCKWNNNKSSKFVSWNL